MNKEHDLTHFNAPDRAFLPAGVQESREANGQDGRGTGGVQNHNVNSQSKRHSGKRVGLTLGNGGI